MMQVETAYQRDLRILLRACQDVELGGIARPEVLELAKQNMADMGHVGAASHFLIYSDKAREARLAGNIVEALRWEAAREIYYQSLPEGARW
jgi:hypothetical protein